MKGIVNIHGKDYVTVAKRVEDAHAAVDKNLSIETQLIQNDPVLFKATVSTPKGIYTGYSAAYNDPKKPIEKQSPYEVAETSAVGRALGFAGYGLVGDIASADEMIKATSISAPVGEVRVKTEDDGYEHPADTVDSEVKMCSEHGELVPMVKGHAKATGREYWSHKDPVTTRICYGQGWK